MKCFVKKQLLPLTLYSFLALALVTITGISFAGKVVFLHGAGSAGKTSLCTELLKQSDRWRVINEDDIYYAEAVKHWKAVFPEEYNAIARAVDPENVFHAVMPNQILFRSNASEGTRSKAKRAIRVIQETLNGISTEHPDSWHSWGDALREHITQLIIEQAKNHHIIVDTWFLNEDNIERVAQKYDVIHVAAYCSFFDIVKRTIKRNCDALMNGKDISSIRFFHQALKSFTVWYDFSDNAEGAIECLEKDTVIHSLDLVEFCLQRFHDAIGASKEFTYGEFSLEEFEEYRKELICKFTSETAYVVPQFKCDMVVRTDQKTSSECAKSIIQNKSP